MSARNRLVLDVFLFVVLLGACNPTITGFSVHEWLSLALAVPTLIHLIINWDWVVHMIDRFAEKIRATSRVNLVVDVALFVATVAVMASGLVVSTSIAGAVGLAKSASMSWHVLHAISANAVFALFVLHTALHGAWIARTSRDLFTADDAVNPARASRIASPVRPALEIQRVATGGHHE